MVHPSYQFWIIIEPLMVVLMLKVQEIFAGLSLLLLYKDERFMSYHHHHIYVISPLGH